MTEEQERPNWPELITVKEFATRVSLSQRTIYKTIKAGGLPEVVKVGKSYRINWDAFELRMRLRPNDAKAALEAGKGSEGAPLEKEKEGAS